MLLGEKPEPNDQAGDSSKKRKKKPHGTHSIRKGVAIFASSGSTGGPSIVSICLRCGWSLGNVMERYFRFENAGDQFTGRVVAGLPVNHSNFAILPPHFDSSDDVKLNLYLSIMFPTLCGIDYMRGVSRLVLASLVFHYDYLVKTLPGNHALLNTPLFADPDMKNYLASIVRSGFDSSAMRASGIPPHIELYRSLEKNHSSIMDLPRIILNGVGKILEEKGVAAGNITKEILEQSLANAFRGMSNLVPSPIGPQTPTRGPFAQLPGTCVFSWGSKLHRLPENFMFPSVDLMTGWRLWWCGNPTQKIPPFVSIDTTDLSTIPKKKVFSEWKYLMKKLT